MGALTFIMFLLRFLFFHLFESPKFLLSRGRQSEAVDVIHGMASANKTTTWLTSEILDSIAGTPSSSTSPSTNNAKLSTIEILQRKFSSFSTERIAPLFSTRKLALTTTLLWFCWLAIGMGYPLFNAFLPQYLSNGTTGSSSEKVSSYITYRNYAITSVVGVPGSILACYTVDIPFIGRKGTMALSTLLSAIHPYPSALPFQKTLQLILPLPPQKTIHHAYPP
ncbi:hypothetical protein G7Y89_g7527 [Cudoniella acicularis]|uniref:Uncharacterized protein n=1 Tax=Cudoniella acicularis TaxID=354080 RepID=A0A8H4W4G8_9HELO|nr:hypothetical protein G7Y89_g7527 [Cudoniella acicularis]